MPKTLQKEASGGPYPSPLGGISSFAFSKPHLLIPVATERSKTANRTPQNIYVNFQISLLKGKN